MDKNQKVNLAANTAIIAGIFTLLVACLLLFNFVQIKTNEPLESDSMELLVERMRDDPNNEELKKEIRQLDLLARRAFFTSQWQINSGRYLMLFGAIVFAFALRYYFSTRSVIEEPDTKEEGELKSRILTQRWVIFVGGILFLIAFLSSFIVFNHLTAYDSTLAEEITSVEGQGVEQIEIVEVSETGLSNDSMNRDENATPEMEEGVSSGQLSQDIEGNSSGESLFSPSLDKIKSNHNSFRGPFGNGVSYSKNTPVEWNGNDGKNIIWQISLQKPGYNSPIIWENHLYIAGGDAEGRVVYCLDRNTGKILWQHDVVDVPGSSGTIPKVSDDTGLSASTLTTDGESVFAIFATGDIVAITNDGKRLWARSLGVPDNHYGHSSSLLVWKDKVLIQFDSNKGGRVLALNKSTGKTIWDSKRNVNISWASPIIAEINGVFQLIMSSDPLVAGYNLETGKELWTVACMMGEVGPSPAYSDGMVYAAQDYARLVAINPVGDATIVWENDEHMPDVASPVVSDGLLFLATGYGVLVCYDAKTGQKYWEEEYNHGFYSSPVIADGKLYAIDMSGVMHIFKVSKSNELIGEPELGESAFATPAFMDGRIYLRGEENLFCIGTN